MPETSIVIKVEDQYSSIVKKMSDVTKNFDKTAEGLEETLYDLTNAKIALKAETDKARKIMQEAQKQFDKTGDAADGLYAQLMSQNYEGYRRKLDAVTQTVRATEKQIKSLYETERKSGSGSGGGFGKGIVGAFAASGIGDTVKQILQESVSTVVSSGVGDEAGTFFSNVLSTASSGFLAGLATGNLAVAAAGAGIGALVGLGNGVTQNVQKKDDAFKDYVQKAAEGQISEMDAIRQSGSSIAGQREQDMVAFEKRFGSEKAAADYLDQVKELAVNTNYSYDEITGYSKSLLNTYDPEKTLEVLVDLSDATAGLNLDANGVSMFINGLSRMRTTGKATQEYLNYFSERGLDAHAVRKLEALAA